MTNQFLMDRTLLREIKADNLPNGTSIIITGIVRCIVLNNNIFIMKEDLNKIRIEKPNETKTNNR
jgi:hypothetical protein